jgi:exopolysaccharide biosynthesis protein
MLERGCVITNPEKYPAMKPLSASTSCRAVALARGWRSLAVLLVLLISVSQPLWAQEFRQLGRGIEHLRLTRGFPSADDATGPFVINLLRIDLQVVDLRLAHAMDSAIGLETVSSMAARYGAKAAINAGFFATSGTLRGDNVGVLKIAGKLLSEPANNRAAVGFYKHNGRTVCVFGHLKFDGRIELSGGRKRKVDGINRQRAANELILYTPEFQRTTLTLPTGVEIVVQRGRVSRLRDQSGSTAIPEDGFVLSAGGEARQWALENLRIGSRLQVKTGLVALETESQSQWDRAENIFSGTPQLISRGRIDIANALEGNAEKFVTDRHPRTAIAKGKDGRILLVVVDGRQPNYSTGMSLMSLAEVLLEFGAVEAINLDGGGSSAMVLEGKLINRPSDAGGERAVSDALLVVERETARRGGERL